MREIKFRAWDYDKKRMFDLLEFPCPEYGGFIHRVLIDGIETCPPPGGSLVDYELMQYTGLKDKNGKEIYEGDIMKDECELKERPCKRHTGVVMWEDYRWKIDLGFPSCDTVHTAESGVVIGNIYENPELIK